MSQRAGKTGDAFAIEQKLEASYDKEESLGTPTRIVDWINRVMAGEANFTAGTAGGWKEICTFLQDGVVLCRLVNKLLEHAGMKKVPFKAKATMAFVKMGNVEAFNGGAKEYGVAEGSLFQTVDLTDGRKGPFINVINCLNQLGFTANSKNYPEKYEAIKPPTGEW